MSSSSAFRWVSMPYRYLQPKKTTEEAAANPSRPRTHRISSALHSRRDRIEDDLQACEAKIRAQRSQRLQQKPVRGTTQRVVNLEDQHVAAASKQQHSTLHDHGRSEEPHPHPPTDSLEAYTKELQRFARDVAPTRHRRSHIDPNDVEYFEAVSRIRPYLNGDAAARAATTRKKESSKPRAASSQRRQPISSMRHTHSAAAAATGSTSPQSPVMRENRASVLRRSASKKKAMELSRSPPSRSGAKDWAQPSSSSSPQQQHRITPVRRGYSERTTPRSAHGARLMDCGGWPTPREDDAWRSRLDMDESTPFHIRSNANMMLNTSRHQRNTTGSSPSRFQPNIAYGRPLAKSERYATQRQQQQQQHSHRLSTDSWFTSRGDGLPSNIANINSDVGGSSLTTSWRGGVAEHSHMERQSSTAAARMTLQDVADYRNDAAANSNNNNNNFGISSSTRPAASPGVELAMSSPKPATPSRQRIERHSPGSGEATRSPIIADVVRRLATTTQHAYAFTRHRPDLFQGHNVGADDEQQYATPAARRDQPQPS